MPESMAARIAKLQQMTTAELRAEWRRVMGEEPRSYNKAWLWKRLAWAIQAREYGGLSARAQARLEELLPFAEIWMPLGKRAFPSSEPSSPSNGHDRLSPGTVITRPYKGRTLVVTVREDGFEHDGAVYRSLTAVARAVTGSHWNGRHFFGLKSKRKSG
ncbi:MAG: DUF2924 domain-containing protein [Acidobacteria bacterium]|nr:DUF2924 domain-containing protein [Acidobacteriota bacterium]